MSREMIFRSENIGILPLGTSRVDRCKQNEVRCIKANFQKKKEEVRANNILEGAALGASTGNGNVFVRVWIIEVVGFV